jgi:hypothetical protein
VVSLWEESIKTIFYFTEKTARNHGFEYWRTRQTAFSRAKPIGKLIPLTLDLKQRKMRRFQKNCSIQNVAEIKQPGHARAKRKNGYFQRLFS